MKQGKYPLRDMVLAVASRQNLRLPSYCGPVQGAEVQGKDLGLVCTRDCPAGTLLLAEHAMATSEGGDETFGSQYPVAKQL